MIKKYLAAITLIAALSACNAEKDKEPVTNMEVARAFVRNVLDNNLKEAEQYLLKDETNQQIYDRFKQKYKTLDKQLLEKYKQSNIEVNNVNSVNDSVYIFNYSPSYNKKDTTILKLVRMESKWLVDIKYTFPVND